MYVKWSPMEDDLPIRPGLVLPGHELQFSASRSGGPGGQHVNKTSSKVTLSWDLAGSEVLSPRQKDLVRRRLGARITSEGILNVHASSERSQHRNRLDARRRLAELVRRALHQQRRRIATRTPASARRKRLAAKRHKSQVKQLRRRPRRDD
jgi:ribosome-associated protein